MVWAEKSTSFQMQFISQPYDYRIRFTLLSYIYYYSYTTRRATRPTAFEPQMESLCKRFSVVVPIGTVLIFNVSATTATTALLLLLLLYTTTTTALLLLLYSSSSYYYYYYSYSSSYYYL